MFNAIVQTYAFGLLTKPRTEQDATKADDFAIAISDLTSAHRIFLYLQNLNSRGVRTNVDDNKLKQHVAFVAQTHTTAAQHLQTVLPSAISLLVSSIIPMQTARPITSPTWQSCSVSLQGTSNQYFHLKHYLAKFAKWKWKNISTQFGMKPGSRWYQSMTWASRMAQYVMIGLQWFEVWAGKL